MNTIKNHNLLTNALIETISYLSTKYNDIECDIIQKILEDICGIKNINFKSTTKTGSNYHKLQEYLSTLNERETIRKCKGVYYTPTDVVDFINENSIKLYFNVSIINKFELNNLNGAQKHSLCFEKKVLDPTCGSGEFLLGILKIKYDLIDNLLDEVNEKSILKIISTIYGNDINKISTIIAKIRIFLYTENRYGIEKCKNLFNILNTNFYNRDFISNTQIYSNKFDFVIGNPPYVEDNKSGLKLKNKYGNIYANVLKNSTKIINHNGVLGFVIPLSYISTPRMKKIRNELFSSIPEQYILSYADRPDCLFKSVHQKLCIVIGKNNHENKCIYTGNYQYWYKYEREHMFKAIAAIKNNFINEDFIPKLGTSYDIEIYKKICTIPNPISLIDLQSEGDNFVYVNMRAAFWIKAFRNEHKGTEYKKISFNSPENADYFYCLINSSLFWWFWISISDCWHITYKELRGFLIPNLSQPNILNKLATNLENKLELTKKFVGTKQTSFEYKHKLCLEEIRALDEFIGKLYGLTESENDYIMKFALNYRIGGGAK